MTLLSDSFYEYSNLDGDSEVIISNLCLDLTKIVSNYPTINFDGFLQLVGEAISNLDSKCKERSDLQAKNAILQETINELNSCLLKEKTRHRIDMNCSLGTQDLLIEEKNSLDDKIIELSSQLNEVNKRNKVLMSRDIEIKKKLNECESLQNANRKLIIENSRLSKIVKKNEYLLNEIRQIPNTSFHSNDNSMWLSDDFLTTHFNILSAEMLKYRTDVIYIDPATTHLLKLQSSDDVMLTLRSLKFYKMNYVFFCLNDCLSGLEQNGGTHWSLLLFHPNKNSAVHYDSIKGCNHEQAKLLLANMGLGDARLTEGIVAQQTAGHECGLHTIINARLLSYQLCEAIPTPLILHSESRDYSSPESYSESQTPTKINDHSVSTSNCDIVYNDECKTGWQTVKSKNKKREKKQSKANPIIKSKQPQANMTLATPSNTNINVVNKELQYVKNISLPSHINNDRVSSNVNTRVPVVKLVNKTTYKKDRSMKNKGNRHVLPKPVLSNDEQLCNRGNNKVLLLSDSHGRGLSDILRGKLSNPNVLGFVKPNGTVLDVLEQSLTVDHFSKNDVILVMTGSNNVPRRCNELTIALQSFLERTNKTSVVVMGVPSRHDCPTLNSKINICNTEIKHLVSGYGHATFVSPHSLGRRLFTSHGLHLNKRGKHALCDLFVNAIGKFRGKDNLCSIEIGGGQTSVPSLRTQNSVGTSLQTKFKKSSTASIKKSHHSDASRINDAVTSKVFVNSNLRNRFLMYGRTLTPIS